MKEKIKNSKDDASAACNDHLKALGFIATAHAWIKVLEVSFKEYDQNKNFYEEKIETNHLENQSIIDSLHNQIDSLYYDINILHQYLDSLPLGSPLDTLIVSSHYKPSNQSL